ncbi:MAG: iron chelate uptake ABC transporter family permease subunit [Dehalococcoidia bacterium]|nr:iron chelate uptake ABC transporter family permease subunit [Dehalococcoidia bacterium]
MALMNSEQTAQLNLHHRRTIRAIITISISASVLVLIALFSIAIGSTDIPLPDIINILIQKFIATGFDIDYPSSINTILFDIRLPRIIMAGLVGAALAVAGAAYQGMFHNPLADPYLTGVSQGAALGAVIGFLIPANIPSIYIPLLAFVGAVLCVVAVFFIARAGKIVPVTTLILGGVALGAFLSSITSYLITISGNKVHNIIFWLLGTFSLADWWSVAIIAPYIICGIIVIIFFSRPLNVMQLDEEQAQQLGINVETVKIIILLAATISTAAAVCFCGTIGFVGIIVPHAVRIIFGPDYRLLLPMSMLTGAGFLILADTASRTLLSPTEIPVGVITALIGAPFFLYILRKRKQAVF